MMTKEVDNWIINLWNWADQNHLCDLTWIEKNGGYFIGLPRIEKTLIELQSLNLMNNKLIKLTDEISNLIHLTELILFNNTLSFLPKKIGNLSNLTKLYLNKNQLEKLPEEICNLTNLTNLSLHENEKLTLSLKQKKWILQLIESGCEVKIDKDCLGVDVISITHQIEEKIIQLAELFSDYRIEESLNPTPDIIRRWIVQFSEVNRETILSEMLYIFKTTYITKVQIDSFLDDLVTNSQLTGNNFKYFWKNISLLNIQKDGNSQNVMVQKLSETIKKQLNIDIAINDYSKKHYIYVDDFIFSGKKLQTDLVTFLNRSPSNIKLDAIYIGTFTSGEYWVTKKWLQDNNSKNIQFKVWKLLELENMNNCQNSSDVLFPTHEISIFDNVSKYLTEQGQYSLRDTNQKSSHYCKGNNIFSSEKNRKILEKEFTLAGLKINASISDTKKRLFWRPLGLTSFRGLGFGAMTTTYRNCPNNTPLALWWGDWDRNSIWTPLFIRKTYERNSHNVEF